jgi:hypothetical protein
MKKKYVLKKWVKDVLVIGLIISIIVAVLTLDKQTKNQEDAINYCVEQGYSRIQCEKGLLGY